MRLIGPGREAPEVDVTVYDPQPDAPRLIGRPVTGVGPHLSVERPESAVDGPERR